MLKERARDPAAIWRRTLAEGRGPSIAVEPMPPLPGPARCRLCQHPLDGIGGRLGRFVGMPPARRRARLCALCCDYLPPGGAEIETAILFADVRGSTALAERLGPTAFAAVLTRFYALARDVLGRHEATVEKLIGDEVMAFFVPGFAGPGFTRAAIEAGQALLRGLGFGSEAGPWLAVGIGIEAGVAYVGNVGGEGQVDFTALGDPVNAAARLRSAAKAGELLVGETAFAAVAELYPGCERRFVEAKGSARPARSLPLARAA